MKKETDNNLALGQRLSELPGFRWLPGMLSESDLRTDESMSSEDWRDVEAGSWGHPNLSDPATLGCLLFLVREAYANHGIGTPFVVPPSRWQIGWQVNWTLNETVRAYGKTEAEALVNALELDKKL